MHNSVLAKKNIHFAGRVDAMSTFADVPRAGAYRILENKLYSTKLAAASQRIEVRFSCDGR